MTRPGLARLTAVFGWIGLVSLGGGRSAYFHDALVVRRGWLRDEEFLQDFALSQVMPGPNFSNLAVALGYRLRGFPGAWCALAALVLPGSVLLLALAVYLRRGIGPEATLALQAMSAAVVGLILVMTARLVRVGLRAGRASSWARAPSFSWGRWPFPPCRDRAHAAIGFWLNRPRASEALTRGAIPARAAENDGPARLT
jgi:chromate transporter